MIINGALKTFKNTKVNKIIFASPLTHRSNLGKTYYNSRESRYSTLDSDINNYYSMQKRRNFKENNDSFKVDRVTPIKINKQTDFIGRSDFIITNNIIVHKEQR